jgi:hypothetical protein
MTRKRPLQRARRAPERPAPEPPEVNPQLRAAILEIVDAQLRDGTPPQTRQTLERLVTTGYSAEGARQLIAHVVVAEIFSVMARGETYNEARFVAALERLPGLPE